jgi:hypothetical protein
LLPDNDTGFGVTSHQRTKVMTDQYSAFRVILLALPALVLLGYCWFVVATYGPYLDWHLRLRSPELAGLPEDVIGFGFWMWWPFVTLLFAMSLAGALSAIERRLYVAISFVCVFSLISIADYLLCERLVQELIRLYV